MPKAGIYCGDVGDLVADLSVSDLNSSYPGGMPGKKWWIAGRAGARVVVFAGIFGSTPTTISAWWPLLGLVILGSAFTNTSDVQI